MAGGDRIACRVVVVMGVSGCGKSTVGAAIAERLGWRFEDGDEYHPAANVEKMSRGEPLTDDDRWPWLDRLAGLIAAAHATEHGGLVLACSALRRAYRDRLRGDLPIDAVRFVLLDPPEGVIRGWIHARRGHFMKPGMLDSQLATLERPGQDDRDPAIVINDIWPPGTIAERVAVCVE